MGLKFILSLLDWSRIHNISSRNLGAIFASYFQGWEPTLTTRSAPAPTTTAHRQCGRHKVPGGGSANVPVPVEYKFNHHEDIGQYMRAYRAHHTCKQAGAMAAGYNHVTNRNRPCSTTG